MESFPIYQKILEDIVKALVNNPESVKVIRRIDEMGVLLSIKVHPQDMGIVIGKKGLTLNAIKHIIKSIGIKNHARVNIKVEEPSLIEKSSLTSEEVIKDLREKINE